MVSRETTVATKETLAVLNAELAFTGQSDRGVGDFVSALTEVSSDESVGGQRSNGGSATCRLASTGFLATKVTPQQRWSLNSLRLRLALICLAVLFLAGCNEHSVLQGLSQRQALEVVAILNAEGILSRTQAGQGAQPLFQIMVAEEDYDRAVNLIVERKLPTEDPPSLSGLFESSSFLPQTRLMETLRIDRALAVEVQEHLKVLPGVEDVKVMIRSEPYGSVDERGVSVLVVARKDSEGFDRRLIEQHIATAFPDLRRDRLVISMVESEGKMVLPVGGDLGGQQAAAPAGALPPSEPGNGVDFLWLWRVEERNYGTAALAVLGLLLVAAISGAGIAFWVATWLRGKAVRDAVASRGPLAVVTTKGDTSLESFRR